MENTLMGNQNFHELMIDCVNNSYFCSGFESISKCGVRQP